MEIQTKEMKMSFVPIPDTFLAFSWKPPLLLYLVVVDFDGEEDFAAISLFNLHTLNHLNAKIPYYFHLKTIFNIHFVLALRVFFQVSRLMPQPPFFFNREIH